MIRPSRVSRPAEIAHDAALSSAINIDPQTIVGLIVPVAWTNATITFDGSVDRENFFPLYDRDGEFVVSAPPTTGGAYIALDPAMFAGLNAIKVRSGTAGSPVNQTPGSGSVRTLQVVIRDIG